MSKVRADEYYDRAGTGRPSFPRGLTGVAVTVTNTTASTSTTTGALVVSGGVGIAGSMHVGENVSIGGTLTYEDVTNIDSVGIITARTGVRITAGGLVVTAGVVTFTDSIGGELKVGSAVTIGSAGLSTFSNGADFNGKLVEETEIVANKASTGFEQINIDKGMIHHFTTLETECFIPDIISTAGINTDLNIGDTLRVGQLSLSEGLSVEGDEENLIVAVNEPVQEVAEEETEEVIGDSDSTSTESEDSSDSSEEQSE